MGGSLLAAGKETASVKEQWLVWPRATRQLPGGAASLSETDTTGWCAGSRRAGRVGQGPGGPGGSALWQCPRPFLIQLPIRRAAGALLTAPGFRSCPPGPASLLVLSSSEDGD